MKLTISAAAEEKLQQRLTQNQVLYIWYDTEGTG
ncbi:iron-sulfur cluster biosynthesis family protein [Alkalicoccus luteus]|uniref:Iron-sulfur cluster biosynthesis family protein n=1 Tax=Alkalicoccus luteus TaxID=1237094 RepID=A0A969PQU0_9BACI|nr:iron-sulfur cluster biosynthesis family protein [Alkalicoccus luteus]NJP37678.1 iron-sulfur cluster biosynthesis family protein [Alkalicoccus luteus]